MSRTIEVDFLPQAFDEAKEKPRILIIDNNRDFTYSAKLALERTGRYSVWEENEPARAHQTAQRVQPGLILLDIAMPEIDGGEVRVGIFGTTNKEAILSQLRPVMNSQRVPEIAL